MKNKPSDSNAPERSYIVLKKKLSQALLIISLFKNDSHPAIGGLRRIKYNSEQDAENDCLLLAQAMLNKAMHHKLPLSGGKAVIYCTDNQWTDHRSQILQESAEFIDSLDGQYITAIDMGTNKNDMDRISLITQHVCAHSHHSETAHATAAGVYYSLLAACEHHQFNISGASLLMEGLGQVSEQLIPMLLKHNCKLYAIETDSEKYAKFSDQVNVYEKGQSIDVFCPNAVGHTLTPSRIKELGCKIVVGAANNQFVVGETCDGLTATYIPDYIANAGGLIYVYGKLNHLTGTQINSTIRAIGKSAQQFLVQLPHINHA